MFVSPEWASVAVTLLLGVLVAYLGHSYRRQVRLNLASQRLAAYSSLWEPTGLAAPTRLDERSGLAAVRDPLSRSLGADDRARLYRQLTTWYYSDGNGILLGPLTRNLYLNAKHNLICADDEMDPPELRALLERQGLIGDGKRLSKAERGCYSIRQLSLLRSQMKADLTIYGVPFVGTLQEHEREFLRGSGASLARQPWRTAMPSRLRIRWRQKPREPARSERDLARDRLDRQVKQCREPRP